MHDDDTWAALRIFLMPLIYTLKNDYDGPKKKENLKGKLKELNKPSKLQKDIIFFCVYIYIYIYIYVICINLNFYNLHKIHVS